MALTGEFGAAFSTPVGNAFGAPTSVVGGIAINPGTGQINASLGLNLPAPPLFTLGSGIAYENDNFGDGLLLADAKFSPYNFAGDDSGNSKFTAEVKPKFLFYIQFIGYSQYDSLDVPSFRVKRCELPSVNMPIETLNQYNKRRQIYTKREYQPLTMTLHDTNDQVTINLFRRYFRNYFYDGEKYTDNSSLDALEYNVLAKYGAWNNKGYGLNPDRSNLANPGGYFFKRINIYTFLDQQIIQYALIHPMFASVRFDDVESSSSEHREITFTVDYEDLSIRAAGTRAGDRTTDNFFNGQVSWAQARADKAVSQTPDFQWPGNTPLGPLGTSPNGAPSAGSLYQPSNVSTSGYGLSPFPTVLGPVVTNLASNGIFAGAGFNFGAIQGSVSQGAVSFGLSGLLGGGPQPGFYSQSGYTSDQTPVYQPGYGYVSPSPVGIPVDLASSVQGVVAASGAGPALTSVITGALIATALGSGNASVGPGSTWGGQPLGYSGNNNFQNPQNTLAAGYYIPPSAAAYGGGQPSYSPSALYFNPNTSTYINSASDPGVQIGTAQPITWIGQPSTGTAGLIPPSYSTNAPWLVPGNAQTPGNTAGVIVPSYAGAYQQTTVNRNLAAYGYTPTNRYDDGTMLSNVPFDGNLTNTQAGFATPPVAPAITAGFSVNFGGIVTSIS